MHTRLARLVVSLALIFWVVTYTGQHVAGPFTLLSECQDLAKIMHARYSNVSEVCRFGD